MEHMNKEKFNSQLSAITQGQAMVAAIRDYQKELLENEKAGSRTHDAVAMQELMKDPELEHLYAERLASMQKEAEKRAKLERKGHGELQEVQEADFLEVVTNTDRCVAHFCHADFERCKILNQHLTVLAKKYFGTRFIKLSAPDAPFFTVKLQVKVLPCMIMFLNGVASDRTVGFDEFGAKDDFPVSVVERRLLNSGVIIPPKPSDDSDPEDLPEHRRRALKQSKLTLTKGSSDEDSDFD
ncbi:hypothetical protein WJX73_000878 [Symbiochloris irregularis]|uniref:Thioredoxin domain-containing protein n=1 Tax=Symbiochloris irregularis TaxID=706552 RepID=A0AAW1NTY1_9CHLO